MTPEFYYDPVREHVMFACPHQNGFFSLPSAIWKVERVDPLTVTPSITSRCGCKGSITDGEWIAA